MANRLTMDQTFLNQLDRIIETHLEDEQFGVEELAKELGLSRSQLHRKLNGLTGKSTSQYIREYRLAKAMEMLQNQVATASEIAYRVGFSSPTYFNTSFHHYFGYTPGEVKYRSSVQSESESSEEIENDTVIIKRKWYNLRTFIIGVLALILVVSIGYYNYTDSENKEPVTLIENSIAVLPFKNMSGNPENEAFCDGMTTAIISRLSKIKGINKVISQTSMMNYKDNKDKSMMVIASELDVHYILESGFQKSGNDIKINLQLIDGISDKLIWSEEYEGKYDSIFKIQARVAEMVAKQLDADITAEEQRDIQQTMTKNMEAYDYYLQGKYVLNNISVNKIRASRKYFENAIALDSTFIDAYIELGATYSMMGTWFGNMTKKKADSLAYPFLKKALQLDPNNLDLLNSIAEKEFHYWNFKSADSLFKIYRKRRGDNVASMFINLILCRYNKVIESKNRWMKKDAKEAWGAVPVGMAYVYYFKDEIDSSLYYMNKGLQSWPNLEPYYDHFGNIYLAMGDYEKAQEVLETGLQISDKRHASMVIHLAVTEHFLGNEDVSLKLLNEVIERAKNGEPEINVFLAHYYARLGNNDEAFKWLDIAYKKHEVDLIWLKADPNLKLLESDPRYQKLVKKIGFLEVE